MLTKSFIPAFIILLAGWTLNADKNETYCVSSYGAISCPSKGLREIPGVALTDDIHTLDLSGNFIQSLQSLGKSR